jgi:hypothetical protein
MCFPKAPKQDPAVAQQQREQRQAELDRLALVKKQETAAARRTMGRGGPRSLISGESGSGFGANYTA